MRIGEGRITGLAFVAAGLATAIAVRAKRMRRAYNFSGKSVAITGGSRGLGLVLARQLAAEGARITLIARDEHEPAGPRTLLVTVGDHTLRRQRTFKLHELLARRPQ